MRVQLLILMLVYKSCVMKTVNSELARHGWMVSVAMLQRNSGCDIPWEICNNKICPESQIWKTMVFLVTSQIPTLQATSCNLLFLTTGFLPKWLLHLPESIYFCAAPIVASFLSVKINVVWLRGGIELNSCWYNTFLQTLPCIFTGRDSVISKIYITWSWSIKLHTLLVSLLGDCMKSILTYSHTPIYRSLDLRIW